MPDLVSTVRKVRFGFFMFWNSHGGSRSLRMLPPDSLYRPHHRGRARLADVHPYPQRRRSVVGPRRRINRPLPCSSARFSERMHGRRWKSSVFCGSDDVITIDSASSHRLGLVVEALHDSFPLAYSRAFDDLVQNGLQRIASFGEVPFRALG